MIDFKKLNSEEGKRKIKERMRLREQEEELISRTIGFSGHRPSKLNNCYDITGEQSQYISNKLYPILERLILQEHIIRFISGGALGFDQIAFWTVQKLKYNYPNICNVVAVPFENQWTTWKNEDSIKWYKWMLDKADEVIYVDIITEYKVKDTEIGEYHVAKMQERNKYMINNSRLVVACWDGSKGGTYNCIKYAKKNYRVILQMNPKNDYELECE